MVLANDGDGEGEDAKGGVELNAEEDVVGEEVAGADDDAAVVDVIDDVDEDGDVDDDDDVVVDVVDDAIDDEEGDDDDGVVVDVVDDDVDDDEDDVDDDEDDVVEDEDDEEDKATSADWYRCSSARMLAIIATNSA